MNTVPVIPESAPFSLEQRAWLNGYLAGLFSRAPAPTNPAGAGGVGSTAAAALTPLTILFGSQTGTAESLAKKAAKDAGKRGFAATALDMAQTDLVKLAGEKNLLVIVSTFGDGEPPDSAKTLHSSLSQDDAPALGQTRYSVCALGDTNYPLFCQCGKEFDTRLEKRGAQRISPRVDCDLDYDKTFSQWLDAALTAFGAGGVAVRTTDTAVNSGNVDVDEPYSKKRPYPARLLTSRTLNAPGSAKQVHHVEFSLPSTSLRYEAGDALGVMPHNCPQSVGDVLVALGCDGEEAVVSPAGESTPLRRALAECYDLGKPSADLLALYPGATAPHHVIDVLLSAPADRQVAPADFVRALKKLQPRLYSISSSPKTHADQVHLTVGAVRYDLHSRARKGVCSTFLIDRALPGVASVGVFVHSNPSFRPPSSGDTPVIMVGPGTGIAPFRAFLQERRATGASGKNWLFFGDQRAETDFLYREELTAFQSDGFLSRLDLAFSRDQAEKIYVQHRMMEAAGELWAWLESGGHFYVCGDASRMAKDVDAALHAVIERAGGKSKDDAATYVQALKASKRYVRDVY